MEKKDFINEIILQRRSIRNYTEQEVKPETIEQLVQTGIYAPTAMNAQCWKFLVLRGSDYLRTLSDRIKVKMIEFLNTSDSEMAQALKQYLSTLENEDYNIFYDAPLLIIVLGEKNFSFADAMGACAAQNMMLAGYCLGLGSCWIGMAGFAELDADLMKEIGVPEGYRILAPIIFGYPAGSHPEGPPRKEDYLIWGN